MSETVTDTAPQGGAPESAEPAATEAEGTAPASNGAATETTETTTEEQPKPSRGDRRIAALSARLAAQAAEIERLRQPPAPAQEAPQWTPEQQAAIRAEATRIAAQERVQERVAAFHAAGQAAHPDWSERCTNLQQMGADAPFAELLVEMTDGARVAAALADDPEELERIVGIRSERGRAIALGAYSKTLQDKPPTPARRVSQAPAPIRPVGGTARVEPNEATMTVDQLVAHYSKQAMDARRPR